MKQFDAIVIGAGSGLRISYNLAGAGKKVAIIESGPFGGTCLNRGCIPSKMLIHAADVTEEVQGSKRFGIRATLQEISWNTLQRRTWGHIDPSAHAIEKGNIENKNITVFKGDARFSGKKTILINGSTITAKQIFICAGTRPSIPDISGLTGTPFWTSKEALRTKKLPKHLIVIGGGYIAAELSHLYSSVGTKVTVLYRGSQLLKREDQEISTTFTSLVRKKYTVQLYAAPQNVSYHKKMFDVTYFKNRRTSHVRGDALLIATGRSSNADSLDIAKAGVSLDKHGYVKVNKYMETNVPGIWAIGDIAGKYFFKHSANEEATVAYWNALHPKNKRQVNYTAMPHAVFTSPQIAGVGLTEQELTTVGKPFAVGRYSYGNTGMGAAIGDDSGFVKTYVDPKSFKILGCHIMGAHASTLIHEVVLAMRYGLTAQQLAETIHIHPALNEVVARAFSSLEVV